ncbi:hypothetical protein GCM10008119_09720 [Pedobacter mendelii]|uniref:TANFOR domain-containing protein n=2 Tax=Pedobacter mendelii TaxID=1908240 RepID=A0ABQ2BGR3_9SPHI|nr:hypothetical protein GCM10008119_09720 [Pedobacter mendelii]
MVIAVRADPRNTRPYKVQLRGTVTGDNGIVIRVKQNYRSGSPIEMAPGETKMLNGTNISDFFEYTQLEYTGITQDDFINKGGLPEGSYQLCIRAYDYDTNEPISSDLTGCSNYFTISSLEPPTIISPMDEAEVTNPLGLIFRWNTPVGTPPSIRYKIRMVEMLGNQNPNDAIMTAREPYFFAEETSINFYQYQPKDQALTPGRKYALMVEAYDLTNQAVFRNQGRSEVTSFTYLGQNTIAAVVPEVVPNAPQNANVTGVPNCSCKEIVPSGTINNAAVNSSSEITVGKYKMKIFELKNTNGVLSGKGTVPLPFIGDIPGLKVRVEFSDLNVNAQLQMISGKVDGILSASGMSLIPTADPPEVPTISMSKDQVTNLGSFFDTNKDQLLSSIKQVPSTFGFELPLGLDEGPVTIGVMGIHFRADQAWFEAATVIQIPDGNTRVALSAKGICLDGLSFCKEATLYLAEDLNIEALGLSLKKSSGIPASGTFVTFEKGKFTNLHIKAEYTFPKALLVSATGNNEVKATIEADAKQGWSNWMAYIDLEPFHIAGLADFKFSMKDGNDVQQKIVYDHSTQENDPKMPPRIEGSNGDFIDTSSPTWTGFYIPLLNVELPSIIKRTDSKPIVIAATNLIFDGGISGRVQTLTAPLTLGDGSLGGWFFSVDNIGINFFKSKLTSGSMVGKLMLPASGDQTAETRNQLEYSTTLTAPAGQGLSFQFTVKTKNDLEFSALWAHARIDNGSNILISAGSNGFKAEATIHGELTVDAEIPHLDDITLGYMRFQNMKFSTEGTLFSPGNFDMGVGSPPANSAVFPDEPMYGMIGGPRYSYAEEDGYNSSIFSGQQSLMGFNFSVTSVDPYFSNGQAGFHILTHMELVNGVNFIPKADLGFSFYANTNAGGGLRKWWKKLDGSLDLVHLEANANLAGMKLEGEINYFNSPGPDGAVDRGLSGGLTVTLPGFQQSFAMKGLFGSRKATSGNFQFFYVDAMLDLGKGGIPMFPGTTLYGFAGGAYYNMVRGTATATYNKEGESNTSTDYSSIKSFSGIEYKPRNDDGSSFGFIAGIYFGLQSRNILEGRLSLNMEFQNGALNLIAIDGDGNVMNNGGPTFDDRTASAMGKVHIGTEILFREGDFWKFDMLMNFSLKYPPSTAIFSATGAGEFSIENMLAGGGTVAKGDPSVHWFLKIGRPWDQGDPLEAKFDAKLFSIGAKSYFQFGNAEIDNIPKVPPLITAIMSGAKKEKNGGQMKGDPAPTLDLNPENKRSGGTSDSGMITGATVEFSAHPSFAIFYAYLDAAMGADLSLKFFDKDAGQSPCAGSNASWYAYGQAYVGASAGCGVRVNVFGFKGEIEFLQAGIAALVTAGAPDPMFLYGELGGYFSVMDGLIDGNFNIPFKVGSLCTEQANNDRLDLIATLNPGKNGGLQNTLMRPSVSFNFPITSDFIVPIVDPNTTKTSYRLFRFGKEDVTVKLNGGSQSFSSNQFVYPWGTDKLVSGRRNDSKVYSLHMGSGDDISSLLPDTKYTFEVNATLKKFNMPGVLFESQAALDPMKNSKAFDVLFQPVLNDNGSVYVDKDTSTFTTDKGPKTIPIWNVQELMPYHRQQAFPINALNQVETDGGFGYIRMLVGMTEQGFDLKVSNPKPFVRVVNLSAGNVKSLDIPVTILEGGKLWRFPLTSLPQSADVALKVYLKGDAIDAPDNPNSTTILKARTSTINLIYKINDRALVMNALAMKSNEQELLAWYFKTGATTDYRTKFNSMKITKLIVGGAEATLSNSKEVNLQNFNWAPDVATKTMKVLNVQYEFKASEPFNLLDGNDVLRNVILPSSTTIPATRTWIGMMARSGLNSYNSNIDQTRMSQLYKDFSTTAFGPGKNLTWSFQTAAWTPSAGGINTSMVNGYPSQTPLMQPNLYEINFKNNNYGYEPATTTQGASGNNPTPNNSNSIAGRVVSQVSIGKYNGQINLPGFATAGTAASSGTVDYYESISVHALSGVGVVVASNNALQGILQAKKDLGYPADAISYLPGFGLAMDNFQKSLGSGAQNIVGSSGLTVPKINVNVPKINGIR